MGPAAGWGWGGGGKRVKFETQCRGFFCPAIARPSGYCTRIARAGGAHTILYHGAGEVRRYCELRRVIEARDATSCLMIPARCAGEMQGRGAGELILYLSSGDEWFGVFLPNGRPCELEIFGERLAMLGMVIVVVLESRCG